MRGSSREIAKNPAQAFRERVLRGYRENERREPTVKPTYCKCERPIIDVEHDAACRRCGQLVNFDAPQPTIKPGTRCECREHTSKSQCPRPAVRLLTTYGGRLSPPPHATVQVTLA